MIFKHTPWFFSSQTLDTVAWKNKRNSLFGQFKIPKFNQGLFGQLEHIEMWVCKSVNKVKISQPKFSHF